MWYSALIFGLLGSFHCVGMCGPIAFLLPIDRKNPTKRFFQILSYHSGRLLTYSLLGLAIGWVGSNLEWFGFQQQVSIAIGILMIAVILLPAKTFNKYNLSKPMYRFVGKIKSELGTRLKRKNPSTFFTLGFLNGLLPCGLVYMAIFGALALGNAWKGGLYMVLFGIGTIPLMTTAVYLGNFLSVKAKKRIVKWIPVAVVAIGVLFILRGMGWDIPFVSPSELVALEQVGTENNCH
ncbi:sulfite exporter TauE/SafE family protein [Aureisphaera galaxeae]|uniref:sulfite exporter TauE/SafE family protein n=1 Tax=Aureisphaera galaxeae TaxID=1538023 RepID=UPI002350F47E|nr:sulfite exporter TauE/SafE family protein [Aureisphaera galaxeae]MDC8005205.1 sulfite exporter TauE/SafE family protein [Aureisphaera galaxeae]